MATSRTQTGDKKEPMSQSGWYHEKAAECNRMALASTNTITRTQYIKDRDGWREIAARIDVAEEAIKQRKVVGRPYIRTALLKSITNTVRYTAMSPEPLQGHLAVARYLNFTTFVSVCSQFGHSKVRRS